MASAPRFRTPTTRRPDRGTPLSPRPDSTRATAGNTTAAGNRRSIRAQERIGHRQARAAPLSPERKSGGQSANDPPHVVRRREPLRFIAEHATVRKPKRRSRSGAGFIASSRVSRGLETSGGVGQTVLGL